VKIHVDIVKIAPEKTALIFFHGVSVKSFTSLILYNERYISILMANKRYKPPQKTH